MKKGRGRQKPVDTVAGKRPAPSKVADSFSAVRTGPAQQGDQSNARKDKDDHVEDYYDLPHSRDSLVIADAADKLAHDHQTLPSRYFSVQPQ